VKAVSHGMPSNATYSTAIEQNGHCASANRTRPDIRTMAYAPGDLVFSPGNGHDCVYFLREGAMRLYRRLADGRTIDLGILGPNMLFVQEDRRGSSSDGTYAEALDDCLVWIVPTDELATIIAKSPFLAPALVKGMTRRITDVQSIVGHLATGDASIRLAATLANLARQFGRECDDGTVEIQLRLTHQMLAGMIGSNRVTVTRKLARFQREGYVRTCGRNMLAVVPLELQRLLQPEMTNH
jgi:CRP/FNR family transcriptional regulator, anaerobic regulatory protein